MKHFVQVLDLARKGSVFTGKFLLLAATLTLASGCAENSALIKASSASMRTDIFEEAASGSSAGPGLADLRFSAQLKTHGPGVYSESDPHGTPDFKLLLNIDGQAVQVGGSLQEEQTRAVQPGHPEAGEGVRYRFSKTVRLKTGVHRVVVAIPSDGIAVEKTITLAGGANTLVLEPVYRTSTRKKGIGVSSYTTFREGIKGIRLTLNGREI